MTETSIVRQNLMDDVNYRPYCSNSRPSHYINGCSSPRSIRQDNGQFKCPECHWTSSFDDEFIERYKQKHNLQ